MTCPNCNTPTYNMDCINCMATWILRLHETQRLRSIEMQSKHDIDELKKLIIKLSGAGK